MKHVLWQTFAKISMVLLLGCVLTAPVWAKTAEPIAVRQPNTNTIISNDMTLSSKSFSAGGKLTQQQEANTPSCSGENKSPELSWQNVPAEAKSLVLTVYDPDAPTGSGFWHWAVYNISPKTTGFALGASGTDAITGIELTNDRGNRAFLGACPPKNDKAHRYIFTLYALNDTLDLPENVSPAVLGFSLNGKILAKASITAYYQR